MYSFRRRTVVEHLRQAGRTCSVLLLLLPFLVACVPGQFMGKKAQCTHPGIQSIDVPSDDSVLLFSYCDKGTSYIATSAIDGGAVTVVRRAEDGGIIQRVIFSPDDRKIMFIERSSRDKSYVHSMDPDGSNLQPVTSGGPGTNNVLDIAVSPDGQRLYYINAAIFRSYSPIATARPHDVDFYSMKLDGSDLRKITEIHAYSLSGLALSGDESVLFFFGGVIATDSGAYLGPLPFEPSPTAGIEGKIAVWTSPHPLSEVSEDGLLVLAS
ncbi:MAG: PD40 domain-containing protein, partial [Gammaproteobacteria bacterium]|nr:PD40 domain-containing protein [Gammaproteobacteria bacterium]